MAVKIRLQRKGRKKAPFYFIVVADSRSPRDGRSIERIGLYNPIPRLTKVEVDIDRAIYWLNQGAVPTKTVRSIFSKEGVLYKKHLMRGVKLGVISEEDVNLKFAQFIKERTEKLEKELNKLKLAEDKEAKLMLAQESKINEQRAKELMAKKQAEIKAKHAVNVEEAEEETEEETVVEDVPAEETTATEEVVETPVAEETTELSTEEQTEESTEEESSPDKAEDEDK